MGRELRAYRLLNKSKCLPVKPSFLLAVSDAVSASEIDTSKMAEGHWVSPRTPTTEHWLHPYLVGDAPLEWSRGQNIGINRYNIVLR
jgi:hypothetical protein